MHQTTTVGSTDLNRMAAGFKKIWNVRSWSSMAMIRRMGRWRLMVVSHLLCSEAEASSSSESQSGTHNSFPQVCLERMQNESRENANIRTFVDSLSSPRDAREGTSFHMFRLHHHQIESIWPRYPSGRRVFGQDSILAANKLFHGVQVFRGLATPSFLWSLEGSLAAPALASRQGFQT